MDFAAGLERDGPVAVKFQLVFPAVAVIREAVRPQQQHRIDETALRFRSHQASQIWRPIANGALKPLAVSVTLSMSCSPPSR